MLYVRVNCIRRHDTPLMRSIDECSRIGDLTLSPALFFCVQIKLRRRQRERRLVKDSIPMVKIRIHLRWLGFPRTNKNTVINPIDGRIY